MPHWKSLLNEKLLLKKSSSQLILHRFQTLQANTTSHQTAYVETHHHVFQHPTRLRSCPWAHEQRYRKSTHRRCDPLSSRCGELNQRRRTQRLPLPLL